MGKFTAYLLLVIFGALILFGSLMIVITPQLLISDEFQALHYPDRPQTDQTVFVIASAAIALLIAYLGIYLLIRRSPHSYLATEYGYANVVKLAVALHMVVGILFAFAVFGGVAGTFGMKFFVFVLLFGPVVGRKLWLLGQRDKRFDHFLEEDPKVH